MGSITITQDVRAYAEQQTVRAENAFQYRRRGGEVYGKV